MTQFKEESDSGNPINSNSDGLSQAFNNRLSGQLRSSADPNSLITKANENKTDSKSEINESP